MASPQPPPGPSGNENAGNGPADKQQSAVSGTTQAQPVLEVLGGDAYAAVVVCALLIMNMTQGIIDSALCCHIVCAYPFLDSVVLCVFQLSPDGVLHIPFYGSACAVCCSVYEWRLHMLTAVLSHAVSQKIVGTSGTSLPQQTMD